MPELQRNLEKVLQRLDLLGMKVLRAVNDALRAAREGDIHAGQRVDEEDTVIDREEVEIEKECIRLIALYQPTAIDLRRIFFVVEANNDLERIADMAANIGRRVKHLVAEDLSLDQYDGFNALAAAATDVLTKTIDMIRTADAGAARGVLAEDATVDRAYSAFVRNVLDTERLHRDGVDNALTLITLARVLERIADHCTNIAESVIFLNTGEIVRHHGKI